MTRALWMTATVAAIVTASAVAGVGPKDQRSAPAEHVALDAASAAVRTPDAPDPRGGPPWAVKEYRTQDGRSCAKPGRRVGGDVGSLMRDGTIRGAAIDEGGVCSDVTALPEDAPLGWHLSAQIEDPRTGRPDPVSFVWGVARPEVARVRIATRSGTRTVPVSSGHTFIAVFPGEVAPYGATLTAYRDDGEERQVVIAPRGPAGSASLPAAGAPPSRPG